MKKLLYIENVASIYATNFYINAAKAAKKCGMEFHLAYNALDRTDEAIMMLNEQYHIYFHQVDFVRSPYDLRNIKAYKQICRLIREEEISVIHCNTPIGGVIGRVAGKKCKIPLIIYQAHGFHFYKGASRLSWLLYYPIEKVLARYTDCIITINNEDYLLAKRKFKLRNEGVVYYIPGVGIDIENYFLEKKERDAKRTELGLTESDIMLISVGDLVKGKNYPLSLRIVEMLNNPSVKYFICGKGTEENRLKKLTKKLKIHHQVYFLGYRTDIKELLNASDLFLFTTKREGLPRSTMEAMAAGLPCVVSKVRGNIDLLKGEIGGVLCERDKDYINAIEKIVENKNLRNVMAYANRKRISRFGSQYIEEKLEMIYRENY